MGSSTPQIHTPLFKMVSWEVRSQGLLAPILPFVRLGDHNHKLDRNHSKNNSLGANGPSCGEDMIRMFTESTKSCLGYHLLLYSPSLWTLPLEQLWDNGEGCSSLVRSGRSFYVVVAGMLFPLTSGDSRRVPLSFFQRAGLALPKACNTS